MSALRTAVEDYLALRRALGFQLRQAGSALHDFVAFLERAGAGSITTALALQWATQSPKAQPAHWANRLGMLRRFAQYWSATDARTEVPPRGLLPHRFRRRAPYLSSEAEIRRLIEAATRLPSPSGLRAWTYATLFGLLAVTGLRISEATGPHREDADLRAGTLLIRRTKFGKSRLVPVHASTRAALQAYRRQRDRRSPPLPTNSFFGSEHGTRLTTARYAGRSSGSRARSASGAPPPAAAPACTTFAIASP